MNLVFSPPSLDDLIRLLKAWRFWTLGGLVGALVGTALFYLAPPPFQARATALVDFNLEEAWPQETDRQQFFYLERETRKLEDIAWSDEVMNELASMSSIPVEELRAGKLRLGQPAEGGWHFYAEDDNPEVAHKLAASWVQAFAERVTENIANATGLNSFIQVKVTQGENLPVERSTPLSEYLFAGSIGFLLLSSLFILLFSPNLLPYPRARGAGGEG